MVCSWSVCSSLACSWSAARPTLTCLFESWSLVLLLCSLLVHLIVRLLVHRWSVARLPDRPSLVRVVDPSLVFLLESSLSYRCLVARPLGSTGHCVRLGSAVRFYTPRGTAVRFYTPRGTAVRFYTRLLYCLTRLALHSDSYSVGCVWPPRCSHTLSHAWCPVTLLSLTRCS